MKNGLSVPNIGTFFYITEHSEKNYVFRNEVEPGVFQSSIQQTCILQEYQTTKIKSKHFQWPELAAFGILVGAPNELFCKIFVLQWVFCWEN